MALRAWSGRRIAFLWLLGIAFYGALAILGYRQRRTADAEFRAQLALPAGRVQLAADTLADARRDSLFAMLFALWREANRGTPAHRDSIRRRLEAMAHDTVQARKQLDSLYLALNVPAKLSPAQRDSLRVAAESVLGATVGPALKGLSSAMQDAAPWLVLASVLLLAPGAALLATTIAWVLSRRQGALSSSAPAA
jgi:hypothetical protein